MLKVVIDAKIVKRRKTVVKKHYEFNETFKFLHKINNRCNIDYMGINLIILVRLIQKYIPKRLEKYRK